MRHRLRYRFGGQKGLIGIRSLPPNDALVFHATGGSQTITTEGVLMPFDAIFLFNGKIVRILSNLQPDSGLYNPGVAFTTLIETNAGWAAANGIKEGSSW